LQDIKTADWSDEVAPFWGEVVKSALTSEGIIGLFKAGWTTIKGAVTAWGDVGCVCAWLCGVGVGWLWVYVCTAVQSWRVGV
jgi:hypothetical protein